jgi:DNA-binding GntR family transcriptional regulator
MRTIDETHPEDTARAQPTIRRPAQLGWEVATYVRELILSGRLKAGEALGIDQIARELAVSSTPVREGLLTLQGEGFLRFEPRRGFRVLKLSRQDVKDLYWIQSEIAGEIGARAVVRLSDEQLNRLMEIQETLQASVLNGETEQIETLNYAFHQVIGQAADSPKLAWILSVVVRYAPRGFHAMIPGWGEATLDDHKMVLEAIILRNHEAARTAMRKHVLHGGELLLESLERRGFWASDEAPPILR